jgi:hypothetical protein
MSVTFRHGCLSIQVILLGISESCSTKERNSRESLHYLE